MKRKQEIVTGSCNALVSL